MAITIKRCLIPELNYIETSGLTNGQIEAEKKALISRHLRKVLKEIDTFIGGDEEFCKERLYYVKIGTVLVLCGVYGVRYVLDSLGQRIDNLLQEDPTVNYKMVFPQSTPQSVLTSVYNIIAKTKVIDPAFLGCPAWVVFYMLYDNKRPRFDKIDTFSAENAVRLLKAHYGCVENWKLMKHLIDKYGEFIVSAPEIRESIYLDRSAHKNFFFLPELLGEYFWSTDKSTESVVRSLRRKAIDERWVSEIELFRLVYSFYQDAIFHYTDTTWLGSQHLDIYVPSMNLAIEYQGEQHYVANDYFGGERGLAENNRRDGLKRDCCAKHGTLLIEWMYSLPINAANLICCLYDHGVTNLPFPDPFAEYNGYEEKLEEQSPNRQEYVVCKYSCDGKLIEQYSSYNEASIATGISFKMIQKAVSGYNKSAGGYQWRRFIITDIKKEIAPLEYVEANIAQPVKQVSMDGEVIATYDSVSKAVRATGINSKSIRSALTGVQKTAGGYYWVKVDEGK